MITVAIIENNPAYIEFLKTNISSSDKLKLIYESNNCNQIVRDLSQKTPDVLIMDIGLPVKSGIEGLIELKQALPEIKVLMLTVHQEEEKVFDSILAGANGYFLKTETPQRILDSILEVNNNKFPISSQIARHVIDSFLSTQTKENLEGHGLTKREKEILNWFAKGLAYKEVASQAFISVETVRSHVKNIYSKLNINSRAELMAKYSLSQQR